ncbi:hypothetical protein BKH46_01930 [Helicobacter sp. 12S02634-8]|nr:hypothetical protein BKH46_01930 [Helicobacter sp. 12S02634-8]
MLSLLGLNIAVSGSLIWASRVYFDSDSDDFLRYYDTYECLIKGHFDALFTYGGGFEIGLPLFYVLLDCVWGALRPSEILFFTILFPSVLVFVWVVRYMGDWRAQDRALCLFFVFLFFNFYAPSQWSRQSFACAFILFALKEEKFFWKYLFVVCASLFHLTSIPIFFILESLKKYPKITLAFVVLGSLSFVFAFEFILMAYKVGFIPHLGILNKLNYYTLYQERGIFMDLDFSFLFLLFCMGVLFCFPTPKDFIKREQTYFFLVFVWLYVVFLPFSYASNRLTLVFNSFLLGYMFFVAIRNFSIVAYGVGFLILLAKFAYYFFSPYSGLWYSYPLMGKFLYYFDLH